MKKYYGIIIIAIVVCGCRTSSDSHRIADLHLLETIAYNQFIAQQDSINTEVKNRLRVDLDERIIIREYYKSEPGDTILSLKSETTIHRGQSTCLDTDIRESEVVTTEQITHIRDTTQLQATVNEQIKKQTDSRLVQGWEWLLISLGISIAIVIIIIFIRKKIPP
ncbi:MAG: hypothetical protein LBJ72_11905 [Dysgonamonadaceae bacterium]|jgi:hypothetical protein|nr:hypothetical protein [Dysgonamonadaceae bacterium]